MNFLLVSAETKLFNIITYEQINISSYINITSPSHINNNSLSQKLPPSAVEQILSWAMFFKHVIGPVNKNSHQEHW